LAIFFVGSNPPAMNCPVVFIHQGSPDYLKWALYQASLNNKNITLLGDHSNEHYRGSFKFELIDNLKNENVKLFSEKYVHMSSCSYQFEFLCFVRWFVLYEYMIREDLEYVFHLDSDVMVYTGLDPIAQSFLKKYQACFHIPEQNFSEKRWMAGAGCSFWTRTGLQKFVQFILEEYALKLDDLREKWKWHNERAVKGGICDMTLLYLFYLKNTDKIGNVARSIDEGYCFDLNFNSGDNYFSHEYKTRHSILMNNIKVISFQDKLPYGMNIRAKKQIVFYNLHFQGRSKIFMFLYYTGKKSMEDRMTYLGFAIPFLWKRVFNSLRSRINKYLHS
jgi:hypothetical protein